MFGGGPGGGLARISAIGGSRTGAPDDAPVVIAAPEPASRELRLRMARRAAWRSRRHLYRDHAGRQRRRRARSADGTRTMLAEHAAFGRYSPTGHLVFERQGRLEAARFSLSTLDHHRSRQRRRHGRGARRHARGPALRVLAQRRAGLRPRRRSRTRRAAALARRAGTARAGAAAGAAQRRSIDSRRISVSWRWPWTMRRGPRVWVGDAAQGDLRRFISDGQSVQPGLAARRTRDRLRLQQGRTVQPVSEAVDGSAGTGAADGEPVEPVPDFVGARWPHLAFTEFQPLTGADIWVLDIATRERRRWCARCSTKRGRASRRMADGSPTCRTNPDAGKSTCASAAGDGSARARVDGRRRLAVLVASMARRSTSAPAAGPWRRRPARRRCWRRRRRSRSRRRCDGAGRRRHRRRSLAGPPGRRAPGGPRRAARGARVVHDRRSYRADAADSHRRPGRSARRRLSAHRRSRITCSNAALFVAEGRLVVRRLLDLRQWTIESILLTQAAADNLARRAAADRRADLPRRSGRS